MRRKKLALLLSAVMIMTAPGLPGGAVYAAEEFQSEAEDLVEEQDVNEAAVTDVEENESADQGETEPAAVTDTEEAIQENADQDTAQNDLTDELGRDAEDVISDGNSETEALTAETEGVSAGRAISQEIVESGECGFYSTYTLYADGRLLINGQGRLTRSFRDDTRIKSVYVGWGITTIADYEFASCSVMNVSLAETVIKIGNCAFLNCKNLCGVYFQGSYPVTFGENAIGYDFDGNKNDNIVIIGQSGIDGETYANENGFVFHNKVKDDVIHVKAVEPSCKRKGNIEYWKCRKCGMYFTDGTGTASLGMIDVVLEETAHELTYYPAREPSCTGYGHIEYWECSVCKQKFSDETATEVLKDIQISPLKHDFSWVPETPATCTERGIRKHFHCDRCGKNYRFSTGQEEYSDEDLILSMVSHDLIYKREAGPTCTEAGNIAYYICENCNKMFLDQDKIHEVSEQDVIIPRKNHDMHYYEEIPATCIRTGKKAYYWCSNCGCDFLDEEGSQKVSENNLIIRRVDHKWGSWFVQTITPTPLPEHWENGLSYSINNSMIAQKYRQCQVCKDVERGEDAIYNLHVNGDYVKLKYGQSTTELKASGFSNGDYLKEVSSGNKNMVTVSNVNKNGTFKLTAGKVSGLTRVTLKLNSGLSATVMVRVEKPPVKTTAITGMKKSVSVVKGRTLTLKPVLKPSNSPEKITYSSSNKAVATVSTKGVITGKKPGTAKITVKSGSIKTVVTVTVTKLKTTKITGVPKSKTLKKGKTFTIKAAAAPKNTDEKITYGSSNSKVVLVTSKGVVKGLKKGTATITVRSGSKKMTCKVTVK